MFETAFIVSNEQNLIFSVQALFKTDPYGP